MNKSTLIILGLIVIAIVAYFFMQGGVTPSASEDAMVKEEAMMEDDAMVEGEVDVILEDGAMEQ